MLPDDIVHTFLLHGRVVAVSASGGVYVWNQWTNSWTFTMSIPSYLLGI